MFIADFIPPFSHIPRVDWNQWCETLLLAAAVLACCEQECLLVLCGQICRGTELGERVKNMNSRNMRKLLAFKRTWGNLKLLWHFCFKDCLQLTASLQVYFNWSISQMLHSNIFVLCSAVPPGDSFPLNSSLQEFESLWNAGFLFKANGTLATWFGRLREFLYAHNILSDHYHHAYMYKNQRFL